MTFLFLLLVVVVGVVAWRYRVKLMARLLGQPEHRIERRLNQRKR